MKRSITFLTITLLGILKFNAWPPAVSELKYDFIINHVLYTILSEDEKTVGVSGFEDTVSDECNIPSNVKYNNTEYSVVKFISSQYNNQQYGYFYSPKKLFIPGSITSIAASFSIYGNDFDCNLEEVYIEDGNLKDISEAFFCCTRLKKVRLPSNIKEISVRAFGYCSELTDINIPPHIEYIGHRAFDGLGNHYNDPWVMGEVFREVTNDLDLIKNDIKNHKPLILPNSIKYIGSYAFNNGHWNNELVLPQSLESIGDRAFSFDNLQDLIIPNSVTKIGNDVFNGCLTYYPDSHNTWDYYQRYYSLKDLKTITLGMSLNRVEWNTFGDVPKLETAYFLSPVPPIMYYDDFPFKGFNPDATIMVPPGKLDVYRNAKGWDHFKNFKELPNVLIQFQIKKYFIASGESAELRYIISNLTDTNIVSEEWTVENADHTPNPDALEIENGYVKGLQSGDYYLTLTLTDDTGEKYSATAVVFVDSDGSGVNEIISDDSNLSSDEHIDAIYNLQGTFVGTETTALPSGIYIVKTPSGSKKVVVR